MWGHGYVITSLLNIAVSRESNEVVPNLIRSHAPRLPGRSPSSVVHLFGGYGPRSQVLMPRVASAGLRPDKGGDDKDPLHFSGEIQDWTSFKEAIQSRADARDTTWLLEEEEQGTLTFIHDRFALILKKRIFRLKSQKNLKKILNLPPFSS
jgi:hypothetical protein